MLGVKSKVVVYGFATGRAKVLETRLVSRARINRLIETENIDEVYRVMAETEYGPDLRSAQTVSEVENIIDAKLSEAYALLRDSNIPMAMACYFQSKHDFINLRVLLKSGLGQQLDVDLSALGDVPVETLEATVKDHSFAGLPEFLSKAARQALAKYNETGRFDSIDATLDRHYFDYLLKVIVPLRSKWINGYTRLLIDIANGRVALRRVYDKGVTAKDDEPMFDGGDIPGPLWVELFSDTDESRRTLGLFPDSILKKKLIEWVAKGLNVVDYDVMGDSATIEYLTGARRFSVGPEPVFAYVAARQHEIKLLRMIITGHLSGIAPARLSARVGDIYE